MNPSPLRVLVVDDSAVVRQALLQILGRAGMQVVTANDPIIAMDKMRREPPDVVVLDIEMPRMDGLTFLQKLMAERPLPVVVCSGLAGPGTEVALHALEEGAVDVVTKPRLGVKGFLEDSARRLARPRGGPRGSPYFAAAVPLWTTGTRRVTTALPSLPEADTSTT